ncbi:MAG: hypothetical protein UX17_C0042G0002 [Parcubacteria group bacterium GW2011_GWC2_45_7]|nr:MAG: hypothetical protein UX17_C0042G0002 [Parcubacteria group bacterium GW2011_GWC2_45_7]KKU73997.1 MAG: hypothetical protein UX98_C0002G0027 [Parcubacteria group bacterium GW2011_GWA2_47_26]
MSMKFIMKNIECKMDGPARRVLWGEEPNGMRGGARGGYSLLLALLITASVAAASSALARIIVAEIRQTRFVDNAIVAQAAAESGGELGLFLLRKTNYFNNPLIAEAILSPISIDTAGGIRASVVVRPTETLPVFTIRQNDFISFAIPNTSRAPHQINIAWRPLDPVACGSSWIEVAQTVWDPEDFSTTYNAWRQPYSAPARATETVAVPLFLRSRGGPRALAVEELRIKALYCDIAELRITPSELSSRVTINAIGEYRDSKQAFNIVAPRSAPLGGLFDFVLFSESELKKGVD